MYLNLKNPFNDAVIDQLHFSVILIWKYIVFSATTEIQIEQFQCSSPVETLKSARSYHSTIE